MTTKITTLLFSAFLLVLTVIWSINAPTGDNITAAVCSAIVFIASVVSILHKDYIILEEKPSKGSRMIDHAMKFQNEIAKYIIYSKKKDRIYLKVKK